MSNDRMTKKQISKNKEARERKSKWEKENMKEKKREIDSKIKIRIWNECTKENKNEKNGLFRLWDK